MDDDIHICGRCRQEFHNLDDYVSHKRGGCTQKSDDSVAQLNIQNINSQKHICLQNPAGTLPTSVALVPESSQSLTIVAPESTVNTTSAAQTLSTNLVKMMNMDNLPPGAMKQETTPEEMLLYEWQKGKVDTCTSLSSIQPGVPSMATSLSAVSIVSSTTSNGRGTIADKHQLSLPTYKLLSSGAVKSECAEPGCANFGQDMSNKVTVQLPGSDQIVTLDISQMENTAILHASNHAEELNEAAKGIVANVDNGTLTQLLTITQAEQINEAERICDTPNLPDDMVATAGTDVITEPPKVYPSIINQYGQKKYICEYDQCKFQTSYSRDLERHYRVHTGEKPFVCIICDRAFNRADKLKIHMRGHTGEKPYQCPNCAYAAADSSSLKMHIRIHTNERPFKCQICPYSSRNSSQLIVHLRTHTGDCPFQCQICQSKFKINSDLKRHMRLHTGEKPFNCQLCDYKCAIKGNLKVHYKINHDPSNALKCPHCEFASSSKRMYREHLKCHDMKERQVPCPRCDYRCLNSAALKAHLRSHSEEKPFHCNYCLYSCKQSGNLKTHVKRKHHERLMAIKVIAMKKAGMLKKNKGEDLSKVNLVNMLECVGNISYRAKKAEPTTPIRLKPHKCNQCDAHFVREDSLKSHVRQHVQLELAQKEMAQTLDAATYSVLQLQNPVVEGIDTLVSNGYHEQATAAVTQAVIDEVHQRTALVDSLHEQTVIEEISPDLMEAREKAAAEEMLREIEMSLGNVKKRGNKMRGVVKNLDNQSMLSKRGRPRGSKNTKPRSQKDPMDKPLYRKSKIERSPRKKQHVSLDENTVIFQQIPQQGTGEQHTIMTANGQQIHIQAAGGQSQQFFTMPRMMSPQQTMTNITTDQNITLNQTNLMAFVQNNQTRTPENNMRNIVTHATQGTVPISMTQMAAQPQAMEQLENQDTTTIHLQPAQNHPTQMGGNNLTSSANIQTGFLETNTSSTQMVAHTGNVFPQTFIIPQSSTHDVSAFIPRGSSVTQHTAQTVTANMQPISQHYIATPTTMMPIQMDMSQHQQQQTQPHQLLRISALPQQT